MRGNLGGNAVPLTTGALVLAALLFLVLVSVAFKGAIHF